jgi:uncharacterized protein (DUF2147 family)
MNVCCLISISHLFSLFEDKHNTVHTFLHISKADRDDAKIKVAALADFLAAVHGACADKPEDEIGKCAFAVGKHMCEASDFDMKKCMDGVMRQDHQRQHQPFLPNNWLRQLVAYSLRHFV